MQLVRNLLSSKETICPLIPCIYIYIYFLWFKNELIILNNIVRGKKFPGYRGDCLEHELLFLLELYFILWNILWHAGSGNTLKLCTNYGKYFNAVLRKKKSARWNMISSPPGLELSVFFLREVWVFLVAFVVVSLTPVSQSIPPPVILVGYPIRPLAVSRLHVGWCRNSCGTCLLCRGGVASLLPAWPKLTTVLLSFSCPEYKKKYGEEHGSCQAGIAGFFTEVSRSTERWELGLWVGSPNMCAQGREPSNAAILQA